MCNFNILIWSLLISNLNWRHLNLKFIKLAENIKLKIMIRKFFYDGNLSIFGIIHIIRKKIKAKI